MQQAEEGLGFRARDGVILGDRACDIESGKVIGANIPDARVMAGGGRLRRWL